MIPSDFSSARDAHSESWHSSIMPRWMTSTEKEEMTDQVEDSRSCNIRWVSRKKIFVANTELGEAVNESTLFISESDLPFLAWIELFTAFSSYCCLFITYRKTLMYIPSLFPCYSVLFSLFLTPYTSSTFSTVYSSFLVLLKPFVPSFVIGP